MRPPWIHEQQARLLLLLLFFFSFLFLSFLSSSSLGLHVQSVLLLPLSFMGERRSVFGEKKEANPVPSLSLSSRVRWRILETRGLLWSFPLIRGLGGMSPDPKCSPTSRLLPKNGIWGESSKIPDFPLSLQSGPSYSLNRSPLKTRDCNPS